MRTAATEVQTSEKSTEKNTKYRNLLYEIIKTVVTFAENS